MLLEGREEGRGEKGITASGKELDGKVGGMLRL
jgi:hypothetical protein